MPEPRLVRLPELTQRLGVGKTKLYTMVNDGDFPKPVKLGNISAWQSEVVNKWIADQRSIE